MATRTTTGTGTWPDALDVAPAASDHVVVADGHVLTVASAAECRSFQVQGAGQLIVDGVDLLLTGGADSTVPGHASDANPRVLVQNGGRILVDPNGGAARLILGMSGQTRYAGLHATGTASTRVAVRKAPGAAGTFAITVPDDGTSPPGTGSLRSIHFEHADIVADTLIGAAYGAGSRITLEHCRINVPSPSLNFYDGGTFSIEDNWFLDGDDANTIRLLSWVDAEPGSSTLYRNRFRQSRVEFAKQDNAHNFSGMDARDNVYLGKIGAYYSAGMAGFLSGSFCCATADEHTANTWNVGGTHEGLYQFLDFGDTSAFEGNPHFIFAVAPLTLTNAVWEFRGGGGVDIGDCIDGGPVTLRNGIILRATRTDGQTAPLTSGTIWALGDNGDASAPIGPLDLECCTFFASGVGSPIGFPHAPYSGPADRVRVKRTLVVSDAAAKSPLAYADADDVTEDTLDPAEFTDNAAYNAQTYSNNTINGVPGQTLKGFSNLRVSAAPTFLDLDASGGPQFQDAGRNFIRWCREVRQHDGTDAEVIAAGIADIEDDPTLTRLSLLPWVRAGYRPQNELLYDASLDDDPLSGRWIGAVSGDEPDAGTVTIRGHATAPVNNANLLDADADVTWSVVSGDATITESGPRFALVVTGDTPGEVVIRATRTLDAGYAEHTLTVHALPTPEVGKTGPFAAFIGVEPNPAYEASDHITPALGDRPLLPSVGPLADLTTPSRHRPVSPYSDAIMAFFRTGDGAAYTLKAGDAMDFRWGSNGMALNVVDSTTQAFVSIDYNAPLHGSDGVDIFHSDPGPWPIPDDARTQGNPTTVAIAEPQGDAHLIVLDRATGTLYEAYEASRRDGQWRASNGWVIDTATGNWAPHVTDTDDPHYVAPGTHRFPAPIVTAAGLPIAPLCVRYDELYVHGVIRHRLGFTMNNNKVGGTWVWPGRGMAYSNIARWTGIWGPTLPYASTLRLSAAWYRANVEAEDGTPIGTWGTGSRVMLRCLFDYGMMLTDGGTAGDFWTIADSRFHEDGKYVNDLVALNDVPLGAFEVADWGEPLVTLGVEPATADIGVERTLSITYHGWERYPGVEHPGYPNAVEIDPTYGWQVWPWQWTAWPARGTASPAQFATVAAGEPAYEDGRSVEIGPSHPTATFVVTPDEASMEWWPVFQGYGPHWDYHESGPVVIATTADEPEPGPAGGGIPRWLLVMMLRQRGAI